MNSENQRLLSEWLQKLSQGTDFLIEQAPLVVQEYLRFFEITSWVGLGAAIALLFIAAGLYLIGTAKKRTKNPYAVELGDSYKFVALWVMIVGLFIFIINGYNLVKVTYAPRIVVIEWLRGDTT